MSKPKSRVYSIFIDFRKAFDSVNHNLLWNKLSSAGVSLKFINILRSLYDSAEMSVKINNTLSNPAKIEKGVLQGEILSPDLFALFLNDIEAYLRSKGCRGISINNKVDIMLLAYADDIVIVADSPHMLMRTLKALDQYCIDNNLTINTDKTKIVIFRKNPRQFPKSTNQPSWGIAVSIVQFA